MMIAPKIIFILAFFVSGQHPKYIDNIARITCIKLILMTVEMPYGQRSIKYKK